MPNHNFRERSIQGAFDMLERAAKRAKVREFEGGLSRSGKGSGIDISQIVLDDATTLRVTADDVGDGITEDMVGRFWFIADYSRTDGDDVIRP